MLLVSSVSNPKNALMGHVNVVGTNILFARLKPVSVKRVERNVVKYLGTMYQTSAACVQIASVSAIPVVPNVLIVSLRLRVQTMTLSSVKTVV